MAAAHWSASWKDVNPVCGHIYFECYIASILEQVVLCQQMGISRTFFDIQALESKT